MYLPELGTAVQGFTFDFTKGSAHVRGRLKLNKKKTI